MQEIRASFCSRCGTCLTDRPGTSIQARGPAATTILVCCVDCALSFERWTQEHRAEPALAAR